MAVCPKWTIFALVMKTRQELTEILDFIAEYATYLLGSGVHTSRVIRNSQRLYRVGADGAMQDITELFRRRP